MLRLGGGAHRAMGPVGRMWRTAAPCTAPCLGLPAAYATQPAPQDGQEWEAVIGIEVHAQINSRHKLLSQTSSDCRLSARTLLRSEGGAKVEDLRFDTNLPNSRVGLCDGGLPGALPGVDEECVRQTCRTGAALGGQPQAWSRFDRKHYFYPDLPNAYQITQQFHPLVVGGAIHLRREDYLQQEKAMAADEEGGAGKAIGSRKQRRIQEQEKREREKQRKQEEASGRQRRQLVYTPAIPDQHTINITRVHLEHDSGKSLHDQQPGRSLIDLNRSGIGLMEIVSEPEIRSGLEAAIYVQKLQTLLQHLQSSEASMAAGSLRCDVNVSVRRRGEEKLGDRCEIKNLNSLRSLQLAVDCEIQRQATLLSEGQRVPQETRGFNVQQLTTYTMRRKETEVDYRYMPEPDIPPLVIDEEAMASFVADLPELPDARKRRYTEELAIPADIANILVHTPGASQYFDTVAEGRNAVQAAQWVANELLGLLAKQQGGLAPTLEECTVTEAQMGSILDLIEAEVITGTIGKKVLKEMFTCGDEQPTAQEVVERKGWKAIGGEEDVRRYCKEVLEAHSDQVAEYLASDANRQSRVLKFFMGQVMKSSRGKADPALATRLLTEMLEQQRT